MKKISFQLFFCLAILCNSSISNARELNESGDIMWGLVCAILGCKINSGNQSGNNQLPQPTTPTETSPVHIEKRAKNNLGLLQMGQVPIADKFITHISSSDLDLIEFAPKKAIENFRNTKNLNYEYQSSNRPENFSNWSSTYSLKGSFIILRLGINKHLNDAFCIEYRSIIQANNRPGSPLFSDVEDIHGVICDNYIIYGGFSEPSINSIQEISWTK